VSKKHLKLVLPFCNPMGVTGYGYLMAHAVDMAVNVLRSSEQIRIL